MGRGRGRGHRARGSPLRPPVCQQVAAEYRLVHRTMAQPPVRGYVPFPWITLVHVKAEHFHALAHYHAALGLCDGACECPAPRAHVPCCQGPVWRLTALSDLQRWLSRSSLSSRRCSWPRLRPGAQRCPRSARNAASWVRP